MKKPEKKPVGAQSLPATGDVSVDAAITEFQAVIDELSLMESEMPEPELNKAIISQYGSLQAFDRKFKAVIAKAAEDASVRMQRPTQQPLSNKPAKPSF